MFAYIPARSGSKRIKNKNIKVINGRPIISYVIENIKKLKFIKEVYVSTDSRKIQKISKKFGANCEFLREKSLANDKAGFINLINKDLSKYIKLQNNDKEILFVLPTAAMVSKFVFKKAYKKFKKDKPNILMSCKKFNTSPYWSMSINKKGFLKTLFPNMVLKASQFLDPLYHDAGLFYFFNYEKIKKFNDLKNSKKILPFLLKDENDGIDIDTKKDWERFKKIFNSNKLNK